MKSHHIVILTIVMAITAIFPASASDEIDLIEVTVKKPAVINLAGEEVGVPENQVIDPSEFPKVSIFWYLRPGEFRIQADIRANYQVESAEVWLTRNGIGPTRAGEIRFSSFVDSHDRWYFGPESGSEHGRPLGSLAPGHYVVEILVPYKDTGALVRYRSEEFEVARYSAYAESCLDHKKGRDDSVLTRIYLTSLGRLPEWVWASIDGKKEFRLDLLKLQNHYGLQDVRSTIEEYWSRKQIDLRMPDGTELFIGLFPSLSPCHSGGGEGPGGGKG